MDPILIYMYVFAGLAAALYLQQYLKFILHPRLTSPVGLVNGPVIRHLVLPFLLRRRSLWGPMTRLQAFLYVLHFAGTIVCNIVGVPGLAGARSRAGLLAILHLLPLTVIPQLSLGSAFFHISLQTYHRLHTSFGIMAIFQSVLHVILAMQATPFDFGVGTQRQGFIVSSVNWVCNSITYNLQAILSIGVSSLVVLPWIRRWAYEICIKFHFALGVCAVVTIWLHLKHRYKLDGLLIIASVGLLVTTTILHFTRQVFGNVRSGRSFPIAELEKLEGAIKLTFHPPRTWKVKAGEFIYVRIPGVRLLSFAESHPFNIAWWEQDESDEKASSISIIAKIESGMTRDLFASTSKSFRVLVDGPYGKCLDTDHCDSIVFIATDIGITAQLPYVKELVQRQSGHYRKKRISLIWELEREGESNHNHSLTCT